MTLRYQHLLERRAEARKRKRAKYMREYRLLHPEKVNEARDRYRELHPDRVRQTNINYQKRKCGIEVPYRERIVKPLVSWREGYDN